MGIHGLLSTVWIPLPSAAMRLRPGITPAPGLGGTINGAHLRSLR
jgi:hypothetical protein